MRYRRLADAVVAFHCFIVVFVLTGALTAAWQPWLAWLHIAVLVAIAAIYLVDVRCPLTELENRFRRAGGQSGYDGSFLGHYFARPLRPEQWQRLEPWVGGTVIVGNALVYGFLVGNISG